LWGADTEPITINLLLSLSVLLQIVGLASVWRYCQTFRKKVALASGDHLRIFVEQAPLAIAMFDTEMRYVGVSKRWSDDYHLDPPGRLLGRSHYDVFPELPQRWRDVHQRCLRGNIEGCDEEPFERADGSRKWVRWEVRPWWIEERVGGILIYSEDITLRKLAEVRACEIGAQVEVEKARRREADRILQAKRAFIATISHELRTPLHAMFGWIQVAQRFNKGSAEVSNALEALEHAANSQSQLVSDILDIQRINRGDLALAIEEVCLDDVTHDALRLLHPLAQERSIRIENLTPHSGAVVDGDRRRLSQCVLNLLSNALKFSPAGGAVEISVRGIGSSVELAVRDHGQGIGAEFLPRVFNRFEQEVRDGARCSAGLGLGLAIVKNLIEAHGGTARAESAGRDKGSTFTLTLPLHKQSPHVD
jgi:PAS domain S-box-containing protein